MKFEKNLLKLICFLLIISLLLFCKNDQKSQQKFPVHKQIERILLPDSLEVYIPFTKQPIDSKPLSENHLKIYSLIDVSCPSCLTNIKNWDKIAIELNKYDIPIILVCQSEDNFELLKYLCEKKDIPQLPFPFYLDTKNQFFIRNKFLNLNPNEHTVLVDKDNIVLLKGDPTLSEEIKNKYFDIIKASKNN